MDEIAKTTAYIGSKNIEADSSAFDRISTTDENAEMLERYWEECKSNLVSTITGVSVEVPAEAEPATKFSLGFDIPSGLWNEELQDAMQHSMFSYFVNGMLAKWLVLTNKPDVETYATQSAANLLEIQRMVYKRKRPERPA